MIHQAKSNPQLLDEQIFSERPASTISAVGTKLPTRDIRYTVAIGSKRT
jgi:hypothetical protein